jgi:hypothetical protein
MQPAMPAAMHRQPDVGTFDCLTVATVWVIANASEAIMDLFPSQLLKCGAQLTFRARKHMLFFLCELIGNSAMTVSTMQELAST